jgi:chorismate dehydratase
VAASRGGAAAVGPCLRVSDDSALRRLRIGCVQYLNARPLIHGYDGPVVFEHPSRLAAMLSDSELDAALVPSFELFRSPQCRIVDGVSIASAGPVFSVFLAYRGELEKVSSVALDQASLTSSNLLRCVLADFHGMAPRYVTENAPAEARLLIGNQAISFRQRHGAEYRFLDLGEEWTQQTGLPFVYALWLIRPEVPGVAEAAEAFRELKRRGVEKVRQIAREETHFAPEFCEKYLGGYIHYELRDAEKAGLRKYHALLVKHHLAARSYSAWQFV